jgi:hypothetical protein
MPVRVAQFKGRQHRNSGGPHVTHTVAWLSSRLSPRLAFPGAAADIKDGRLAVDEPLANRVRSGRKQP